MKTRTKRAYAKGTALSVEGVLDEIADSIEYVEQNANANLYASAAEYAVQAETLIKLLEVHQTGSWGATYLGMLGGVCLRDDLKRRLGILIRFYIKNGTLPKGWKPYKY